MGVTYGSTVGGTVVGGILGGLSSALAGGDLVDVLQGMAVGAIQGTISSGPLHALEGAKGMQLAHVAGHGAWVKQYPSDRGNSINAYGIATAQ